jgi:hypothetical protein
VTRLLLACCALALVLPVGAPAQDPTTPATAQGTTSLPTPTTAVPTTTAPATPAPTTTQPAATAPAVTSSAVDRDTAAIVLLLVVGGLLLAALVLWAVAYWQAWEPPWLLRWRHATGEAGWRVGNAWSEFTDWLRLGR